MKPREGESKDASDARKFYLETGDVEGTLRKIPKYLSAERMLLRGLIRDNKNFKGGFYALPRNMRLLYLHSYQSYVWNTIATMRINLYGHTTPVVGDLVIEEIAKIKAEEIDLEEKEAVGEEEEQQDGFSASSKVRVLTEEDIKSGKYTISDVVLPLPGFDVVYPKNALDEKYKEVMAQHGIDSAALKLKNKDLALPGSYRRVIEKPRNVSWDVFNYNDVTIPLTRTDMEILQNKPEPQSVPDGKMTALRVAFTLSTGCYATMALRELMKISTSQFFHKSLNTA